MESIVLAQKFQSHTWSIRMLIDLTLPITPKMTKDAQGNEKKALAGHLGTHFDVMDQTFSLDYTRRVAIVFDVSAVHGRDIEIHDIDLELVHPDMFVAFHSGFIERVPYGSTSYFSSHPQLSFALIEALLDRKVSIIGIDFAGVRRGSEHTPTDQRCADHQVFIIENLVNLEQLPSSATCVIHTYPMNFLKMTGLPCRVVAEV